jgi:AraC-like DNA-binding protein
MCCCPACINDWNVEQNLIPECWFPWSGDTKMPWSSIERFSDPAACQQSIQGVSGIEVFPTSGGNFDTEITKVRFDRVWMQRFHSSLPQIITCEHPRDRQAISFLTEPASPKLLYCGREVLPGDLVVSRSELMHKRFDADVRKGAMSLPKDELNSAFEAIMGQEFVANNDMCIVRPDPIVMSRLLKLHKAVGRLACEVPDILEAPAVDRALEQQLIHCMVWCLAESVVLNAATGQRRHDQTMIRFEEYLETRPDQPVYLTEICVALGVAERTLRACCEEHLGMGPIRYLTLRRMHLVHRALLGADAQKTTVTGVVTDHGFWELGRFSVAYRSMFGETPSQTLRRPPRLIKLGNNRPSHLLPTNASVSLN